MSGILGSLEPAASTWKTLYKPGSGIIASCDVAMYNRASASRTVDVALVQDASTDPTPGDGTRFKTLTLEATGDSNNKDGATVTGITLDNAGNDQIVIRASGIDVDFVCAGIEE